MSSIVDHLRDAAVVVVPLRIGGGTRIKIYEGMAMGKATVSTRLGAEGLDVHHGRDILLADEPRQFAEHVVRFLRDEETRRKYEAAAAAAVQKYDWSAITERLIESAIQNRRADPPNEGGYRADLPRARECDYQMKCFNKDSHSSERLFTRFRMQVLRIL